MTQPTENTTDALQLAYRSADGRVEMLHLDGVGWFDAPIPRRFHRCTAQTVGYLDWLTRVERCACGALRYDGSRWLERNARRKP